MFATREPPPVAAALGRAARLESLAGPPRSRRDLPGAAGDQRRAQVYTLRRAAVPAESAEEQFRGHSAHARPVLGHHGDPRPQHVGELEIVKRHQRGPDILVGTNGAQEHDSDAAVTSEECGRRKRMLEHAVMRMEPLARVTALTARVSIDWNGSAMSSSTSPTLAVEPCRRSAALSLRLKPNSAMAAVTSRSVSGRTYSPLTTRDTLFMHTPARAATSRMVGRAAPRGAMRCLGLRDALRGSRGSAASSLPIT